MQRGESGYEKGRRLKVKLEVEDGDGDERGSISKRAKVSSSLFDQVLVSFFFWEVLSFLNM